MMMMINKVNTMTTKLFAFVVKKKKKKEGVGDIDTKFDTIYVNLNGKICKKVSTIYVHI